MDLTELTSFDGKHGYVGNIEYEVIKVKVDGETNTFLYSSYDIKDGVLSANSVYELVQDDEPNHRASVRKVTDGTIVDIVVKAYAKGIDSFFMNSDFVQSSLTDEEIKDYVARNLGD